jgi:hypothetical protein
MSLIVLALLAAGASEAMADEVRYCQQDGVTYRETRRVVRRPVTETRMESRTQTVYHQERTTEMRETTRTRWSPVTEYRWEQRLVGRWNPFVKPYFTHRCVPHTWWEQQTEVIETPVTCCRCVPETRTVQVPVTTHRMVNEEVIHRVAVGSRPSTALAPIPRPTLAAGEPVGGVARLDDKDPPRHGVSTAWRPATTR